MIPAGRVIVSALLKKPVDVLVSLLVYFYFTAVFAVFFLPAIALARLLPGNHEAFCQKANHFFYRGFFFLLRVITPGLRIRVDKKIRRLRSSVVVCNHISYLDSILLTSLFKRHKTVVRSDLFDKPFLGFVLKSAGYLPSSTGFAPSAILTGQLDTLDEFFGAGGVLFVFPEGTRGRDGRLAGFKKGAFSLAQRGKVPIEMLRIRNTARLFPPGKFLFRTCVKNVITLDRIGRLEPDYEEESFSLAGLVEQAHQSYQKESTP